MKNLTKANIPYAIVGGMAVYAHGYRRTTNDVDILPTPEGLQEFKRRFVPKQYDTVPKRGRRFLDRTNDVTVDILLTGHFPGRGEPGPISFPNPEAVGTTIMDAQVIDRRSLIQLKLAARRHQDFADVVNLIKAHNLDESYADELHPSVRRDFIECLEEKRREDEYLERNG